jgi:hypothetical protein
MNFLTDPGIGRNIFFSPHFVEATAIAILIAGLAVLR